MSKEEETAFAVAVRKARGVNEIHAAFELLPRPTSESLTTDPTSSENMWLAILQARTAYESEKEFS